MKKIMMSLLLVAAPAAALALTKSDLVGAWALDGDHSQKATDGNTAGALAKVEFKPDGSFDALYGLGGTWKLDGKKLLVTWKNSFRHDEVAPLDGAWLKMPSPSMQGKFCYLRRQ
jgi:hypothetical protein